MLLISGELIMSRYQLMQDALAAFVYKTKDTAETSYD